MSKPGASTVLLLIVGAFLLMLGFSGKYKAIFSAAFPMGSVAGSTQTTPTTVTQPGYGLPLIGGGTPVPVQGSGGFIQGTGQIVPNSNGNGYVFQP